MAGKSSFGGTVKLTGESEYKNALTNITSSLKTVNSELKLATTEFNNNGQTIGDLRKVNETLINKYKEESNIVNICSDAIKDFTNQQSKNKEAIDSLKNKLDEEKKKLEETKNSTTATNAEIEKQEKVVQSLEAELSKSQAVYDANNRKINDYQSKLNNAKIECSNLTKNIDENNNILEEASKVVDGDSKSIKEFTTEEKKATDSVEEFSKEEENASKSTLKLGDIIKANLISDAITSGLSTLVDGMKKLGSAMVDVGKQAMGSYADYEQLIGGVETLFGDSANVVEGYANNAYKTAGLSANEYMETVTSFSASLLQSLNGDTAKSAEVADMAIIDMADNANKMGTSMESIQNAYQGFAKQNYTMLDNLKLGYGGTKTEMERLLKDAEAISGIHYDISSYADVTQAIHVIQESMGIAGTTAKEANTTIQGSVSSVKSAYQNLLTGFVSGNSDISQLIDNLVDSVFTAADNILPKIEEMVGNIMEMLPELIDKFASHLPEILEFGVSLLNTLMNGIQTSLPQIMPIVVEVINTLVSALVQMLPDILQAGITILMELVKGIGQSLPTLIPAIVDAVVLMTETLIDNIDLIIDAGIELIIGLAEGLIEAIPRLIEKIPVIIDKLINAITDNMPKIVEMGITLIVQLGVGLIRAIPQLITAIPKIITSLVNGFNSSLGTVLDIGKNLVKGIWNGINNATDWILDKIKGFGKSVLKGIKNIFGIHSPSTVFRDEIGTNLALGIGEGFTDTMTDVQQEMADAIPTKFDTTINSKIGNNSYQNVANSGSFDNMVIAFKTALKDVKVIMDEKEMGTFVTNAVEEVVYS